MNLAQLQAAVITETNRPDLVPETLQAVLESTLSVHTLDNFYKDVVQASVTFTDPTQYLQTIDTTVLARFRNMAFIRKASQASSNIWIDDPPVASGTIVSVQNSTTVSFLTRVDIADIIDIFGYEKQDIWYQAGTTINIKSSTALGFGILGYYTYPNLTPVDPTFTSWIANELPYVIVYRAAGNIFAKIGEDKSYAIYMKPPSAGMGESSGGLYYQQLAQLRMMNIESDF